MGQASTTDQRALIHDGDWDTLLVLDSCRYDYFAAQYPDYLEGDLRTVESAVSPKNGYATSTWCNGTFTGRLDDVTYVSTTLRINSRMAVDGFHGGERFGDVIDLWETGWNDAYGTVLPATVAETVREERDRADRMIVHYSQPHFPYLSLEPPDAAKGNDPERRTTLAFRARAEIGSTIRHLLGDARARTLLRTLGVSPLNPMDEVLREHGPERLKEVYAENLALALESVSDLADSLPGTTVVTADHGELLGEADYYGHSYVPDHEKVSTVPWFELAGTK